MTADDNFAKECADRIDTLGRNGPLRALTSDWLSQAQRHKYSYHFRWLGLPIIQYPQDIVAMQELIWRVQPDLIIETGVARGGSLIFSASMLALLDLCAATQAGETTAGVASKRRVVGVDIDIRAHNRVAIEAHPLASYITLVEGSSVAANVTAVITKIAQEARKVLVCLDSNHTHDHVLAELEAYAPLASVGSYCVVFDTIIEDLPAEAIGDRPWGNGNSPKTAVDVFLRDHPEFEVDTQIDSKLLISVAPGGYLRRVR